MDRPNVYVLYLLGEYWPDVVFSLEIVIDHKGKSRIKLKRPSDAKKAYHLLCGLEQEDLFYVRWQYASKLSSWNMWEDCCLYYCH